MPSTASVSSQLVASAVALGVAPLLKARGFRKQRHRFYRSTPDATEHVEVQSSQWNAPNRASFTINLWTYLPAIAHAANETPVVDPLRQRLAHCGIRIGHLLETPGDYWWTITQPSQIEPIAKEVATALERFGLPYLERAATLEGVAALSGHIPGICSDPTEPKAIALRLLSREAEANAVEAAIAVQREAARARLVSLRARTPSDA